MNYSSIINYHVHSRSPPKGVKEREYGYRIDGILRKKMLRLSRNLKKYVEIPTEDY